MRKALIIALSSLALGLTAVATGASAQDAAVKSGPPSADWPIGDLIADTGGHAVLAKDLPELLAYDGLDQIKGMSLRQVSQIAPDKLPSSKVDQVDADLKALPPPAK
jgi:hypothetical protein